MLLCNTSLYTGISWLSYLTTFIRCLLLRLHWRAYSHELNILYLLNLLIFSMHCTEWRLLIHSVSRWRISRKDPSAIRVRIGRCFTSSWLSIMWLFNYWSLATALKEIDVPLDLYWPSAVNNRKMQMIHKQLHFQCFSFYFCNQTYDYGHETNVCEFS